MSKIFVENQKVLVSMKKMIDTLSDTMEQMQKQSRQIKILEDDTEKLFSGLSKVRTQSGITEKINQQTMKLQEQIDKITNEQKNLPDSNDIIEKVSESFESIRNNSKMIMKIADRVENVKDDLKKVSIETKKSSDVIPDISKIKEDINSISNRAKKIGELDKTISSIKEEIENVTMKAKPIENLNMQIGFMKNDIEAISERAVKIDELGVGVKSLKNDLEDMTTKANQISNISTQVDFVKNDIEAISERAVNLGTEITNLREKIGDFSTKRESKEFLENFEKMNSHFVNLKDEVGQNKNLLNEKISDISETLKRADSTTTEFHKKTDRVIQELQNVKKISDKTSDTNSKEVMGLLKLSEYQSNIRMQAESKYGTLEDIEKMAQQTTYIVNLFDRLSIETEQKIALPYEVRQWAVGKILDCADRWEVRFTDVFDRLITNLGRSLLKESIRIQQVREIFGIRAVDEIKNELGLS